MRILCTLSFHSGLRSGSLAGDLDRVTDGVESSTIWGGIGCCAARLFDDETVTRLVSESSLSSLLWSKDNVFYVPRPLVPFPASEPDRLKEAKRWGWLPVESLEAYLQGRLPGGVPVTLYQEERQRSVALDRTTNSAVPYFRKRILPLEGTCGVLVADIPDHLVKPFTASMRLLGDTGLGGERSSGWGTFTVTFAQGEGTPFDDGKPRTGTSMALGLLLPSKEEAIRIGESARQDDSLLGYDIRRIRGFTGIASDISKPTVTCLAAGSLFPFRPEGIVEDITPAAASHTVLFNGRPPFLSLCMD